MCCTHPYKKQETPNCNDRIRAQRLSYATIGPVAQLTKAGTWEEKKQTIGYLNHTPTSKEEVINRSHDPCWRTPEDKKKDGILSAGSSKYSIKPQVQHLSFDSRLEFVRFGVLLLTTAK